jgi:hypothetical protein
VSFGHGTAGTDIRGNAENSLKSSQAPTCSNSCNDVPNLLIMSSSSNSSNETRCSAKGGFENVTTRDSTTTSSASFHNKVAFNNFFQDNTNSAGSLG